MLRKNAIVLFVWLAIFMSWTWSCSQQDSNEVHPVVDGGERGMSSEKPSENIVTPDIAPETKPEAVTPEKPTGTTYAPNLEKTGHADDSSGLKIVHLWMDPQTVFACTETDGFVVYDISDPTQPKVTQKVSITSNGKSIPHCRRIVKEGDTLYTLSQQNEQGQAWLAVFEIKDKKWIQQAVFHQQTQVTWSGLAVKDGKIFVAARTQGISIFQQDTSTLNLLKTWGGIKEAWDIVFDKGLGYIADGEDGLQIVDFSQVTDPKIKAHTPLPGVVTRVRVHDGKVYATMGPDGFAVVDLATPDKPTVTTIPTNYAILDLVVQDRWVMVTNLYDIRTFQWQGKPKPSWVGRLAFQERDKKNDTASVAIGVHNDLLVIGTHDGIRVARYKSTANPILELSHTVLHFGHVSPGKRQSLAVAFFNRGQKDLTFSPFQVTGEGFQVDAKSFVLKPGDVDVVELTVEPKNTKSLQGTLQFTTNDPVRSKVSIPLVVNPEGGRVGEQHPTKTWSDLSGQKVYTSESLQGKVVLLVYFATWCTDCNKALPLMENDLWQPFKDKDFVLLAIAQRGFSGDSGADLRGFVKQSKFTFPVVLSHQFSPIYPLAEQDDPSATPYPVNVLLDRQGKITYISRKYDAKAMRKAIENTLNTKP